MLKFDYSGIIRLVLFAISRDLFRVVCVCDGFCLSSLTQ